MITLPMHLILKLAEFQALKLAKRLSQINIM